MKKQNQFHVSCAVAVMLLAGCKTLSTNVTVPSRTLPSSYSAANDSSNIADISWKQYFTDNDLVQLIDTALANNSDLQIALQRIEAARASLKLAKGALFPTVTGVASAGTEKYAKYTSTYAGNSTADITKNEIVPNPLPDYNAGFQASWEADVAGKLRNQKKSALAQYMASIEGTNYIRTSLVADVASAYYELLSLDNELDIIRQTIQRQTEALDVVKAQKEAARANELAVQQFNAQLISSVALEKETQQQITETENRINFLLGRFPQPITRKKENLFNPLPENVSAGIPSSLLEHRTDIRQAELMVQASKFDLRAAKDAFFPSFNMTAGYGFEAFKTDLLFLSPTSVAYSVLGTLTMPLINQSALKAQFNTAKSNQLQAMYTYQKTVLNAYVEVANELSAIENLRQINALKKQQADALTKSVDISDELYKAAKASYLEVLLAQQNALQTQLELIDVNKRSRISTVNIYKALGGGWK